MDTDFQVLVVQTGGTIDKDYPRATGQYAFEIGESAALKILNQSFAPVTFRVTSLSVCRKDSQVRTEPVFLHASHFSTHKASRCVLSSRTHGGLVFVL